MAIVFARKKLKEIESYYSLPVSLSLKVSFFKIYDFYSFSSFQINIPFAILAVYFMAIKSKDNLDLICTLVYGTSLVMLFTVSTLFHVISLLPKWR